MFNANGFLVTKVPQQYEGSVKYSGIETGPWPLDEYIVQEKMSDEEFQQYENVMDNFWLDVKLMNKQQMESYVKICREMKESVRILYIETKGTEVSYDLYLHEQYAKTECFLGYDVGQCGGDYYSALLMDIILRPELLGEQFGKYLNQYGLFNEIEDVIEYIEMREKLKEELPFMTFEGGIMHPIGVYSGE